MTDDNHDESIANAINSITQKLSGILLREFSKLPNELQMNMILIKSTQLLLANILCHIATTKEELEMIAQNQGTELHELTFDCAYTGFLNKFEISKH